MLTEIIYVDKMLTYCNLNGLYLERFGRDGGHNGKKYLTNFGPWVRSRTLEDSEYRGDGHIGHLVIQYIEDGGFILTLVG